MHKEVVHGKEQSYFNGSREPLNKQLKDREIGAIMFAIGLAWMKITRQLSLLCQLPALLSR